MSNLSRVLSLTLLFALPSVLFSASAQAEKPFEEGNFKSALSLARRSKRIVLVDFYTTWCGPCKQLDETTWKDKIVRLWLAKHTISRKIDAEKETKLAEKYKIRAYPTILLLKPDGTEIDRLVGYREPKTFLTEVKQALAGQDSIARAKAKLNAADKNSPMERMDYARALADKGRNAEALKEYLWCLDKGNQYDPNFSAVRLSFLLSDLVEFSGNYPPAQVAVKKRRDAVRMALQNGSTSRDVGMDFASYNEYLEQQADTLEVYDGIKGKQTPAATALFESLEGLLLERKRYADLVQGKGDIIAYINEEIYLCKEAFKTWRFDKKQKEFMVSETVKSCANYYEALVGTDKEESAEAIVAKLLAFAPGKKTYTILIEHATRAGKPEVAQKLKVSAKLAKATD